MTAHYLATSVYQLSSKTTCLVHAGGGGTGGLLIQIAKMLGAKVVATAGSIHKAEKALAHGADRIMLCAIRHAVYPQLSHDTECPLLACVALRPAPART
jgi:NADPH:quinone reductase-like Zn-dependent oxidoreductase